ncbi:MAG: carbohydrate ABC transporter permease [Phycisphaerae bacterium]|nr:carbohydrate ABC transporter permease [Phycisphaerae bacterium]
MHRARPAWRSLILHGVLLAGSCVFVLPYLWLLGTSWKMDKEVQSDTLRIFPRTPVPRATSPYVDRTTHELKPPDDVDAARWSGTLWPLLRDEIARAVETWIDAEARRGNRRLQALSRSADHQDAVDETAEGVYARLRATLPGAVWTQDDAAVVRAVRQAIEQRPQMLPDAFNPGYRYVALSRVIVKDTNYGMHDVTGRTPVDEFWRLGPDPAGVARLAYRSEDEQPMAVVSYDFGRGEAFELAADFELPVEFPRGGDLTALPPAASDRPVFKSVAIGVRRDETWHELRALAEINGELYRSAAPKYLGEDSFLEDSFQLPGPDDDRLAPKLYVRLERIDAGPQYDHGPNVMRLRVQVSRSTPAEAYWAKGTDNYREMLAEVPFWRYLGTSTFLALANIAGTCFSCSLAAYAFARLQWPGRQLCFALVLATLMIPVQVTMIPSFVIYRQLGWYNTLAPLFVPACLGIDAFAIFLLRQAMKGIPRDLEDAAKIDGCGFFRIYWHVALPLMKPTLAAISVFTFMYVWNDFMGPLIYVNDQRLYPLALGLFSFMAGKEMVFTLIMAGAVVMTVPVILIFLLAQRYFIQGVALTGVKG